MPIASRSQLTARRKRSGFNQKENIDAHDAAPKTAHVHNQACKESRKQQPEAISDTTPHSNLSISNLENLNRWQWLSIPFPTDIPFTEDSAGGFVALEEIDGVDVQYEDGEFGRAVKFVV